MVYNQKHANCTTSWTINVILFVGFSAMKVNYPPVYLQLIFEILSSLDFFSISNSKKNWFRNKLDFLSSSNLIFTACVACKNQKIEFVSKSIFFRVWNWEKIEWHSIFQKSSGDRQGSVQISNSQILTF